MGRPAPVTGRELGGAVAVSLVVMGVLVGITALEGALGVARNDDWSFIQNAFTLHDTGTIAVTGWVQMLLIGQLLIAAPVVAVAGHSIAALQLVGAAFGALLLLGSYLLARTMLSRGWAALAALTLAIGPVFGTISVSFMTDVPAAALQVLTVLLGVHALRRSPASRGWLIAAGAVGVLAFSVREYTVVGLGVVFLLLILNRRHYGIGWGFLAAWVLVLAAAGLLLVRWRAGQVTENASEFGPNLDGIRLLAALPLTLGLLALPGAAFAHPGRLLGAAWRGGAALTSILLLMVTALMVWSRFAFLGNYWSETVPYSQSILGDPPALLPRPLWWAITAAAVLGAWALTLLLSVGATSLWRAARARGWRLVVAEHVGAAAAALLVTGAVLLVLLMATLLRIPVFDRYFVAIIAPLCALALFVTIRSGLMWQGPGRLVGWVAVALLATVGLVSVCTAAAVDAAKWRMAQEAADSLGVGRGNIDGGFEWFSFQTDGAPRPQAPPNRWTWWTAFRDDRAVCATLMYAGSGLRDDATRPDPSLVPLATATVQPLPGISVGLVMLPGPDQCGQT